jgi:predicted amidohydrolase YtcJ
LRDILAAASYNRDHNGADGERPFRREAVTQLQALAGITVHPAAGSFMEDKTGRIRPGNWGDWVVIDKDAFTQELIDDPDAVMDQFDNRHILETWFYGTRR